jgi:hypothetical protein
MSLSFKALSVHPIFNEDDGYYFMALKDPDLRAFNGLDEK